MHNNIEIKNFIKIKSLEKNEYDIYSFTNQLIENNFTGTIEPNFLMYLLELSGRYKDFCVHQDKLIEYGVVKSLDNLEDLLDKYKLYEDDDYIIDNDIIMLNADSLKCLINGKLNENSIYNKTYEEFKKIFYYYSEYRKLFTNKLV